MERLTADDLKRTGYDPWELCGMDHYCTKGCHEEGGCTKGCHILKLYKKLAEYEDLEEQAKLMRLPCAVGDTVYIASRRLGEIIPLEVCKISILLRGGKTAVQLKCTNRNSYGFSHYSAEEIGKNVFLTPEKAKAALDALEQGVRL